MVTPEERIERNVEAGRLAEMAVDEFVRHMDGMLEDAESRVHYITRVAERLAAMVGLIVTQPVREKKPVQKRKRVSHDPQYVFAHLQGHVAGATDRAIRIEAGGENHWFPRSCLAVVPEIGDHVDGVWVKRWLASERDYKCDETGEDT